MLIYSDCQKIKALKLPTWEWKGKLTLYFIPWEHGGGCSVPDDSPSKASVLSLMKCARTILHFCRKYFRNWLWAHTLKYQCAF